ncbi:zinc finger, CCHC-type containing protein [Tanacetum coccineum]
MEEGKVVDKNVVDPNESDVTKLIEVIDRKEEIEGGANDETIRNGKKEPEEELMKMPRSQPIGYYLKHEINIKLIEGLIRNQRFNDSLLAVQLGKMDNETYNSLPVGPIHMAILKKKIIKKEDMGGNFAIPCSIGGLKYMDALVDRGSNVNVMPLSIQNRITNEKLVETDIRLSLASQSHIYPLGIAKDVLVEIASFIYPVDFVILDIKEEKKRPFIIGTPFLTTAKAKIRFDKGITTLKSGKNKVNFHKIPEFLCKIKEETKDGIDPVTPASNVNKLILE